MNVLFGSKIKYPQKKIGFQKSLSDASKLQNLMSTEMLFKNPNLRLIEVAESIGVTPHYLSQLINETYGISFSQFVNEFRVREAVKIIENNTNYSLEGVGYEAGFNSKSNFYHYFKKIMGTTPKDFIRRANV
ncbi:helix-turn-helix domain-containing protein [Muricauda sp. 2012CJ35-5]|uniref:Helix-turn-helix domain-containing protein n=1 Tax=Flagellimonas spongiicola TaxID=2942208 RepID=A0ABT0PSX9_9FLAO|nr:helix-turn-helix domain-containing protein [Allomuricauda spongiicola]MCL6274488.1 helix-turn-helix domain-containing protein [Allomuricauda spongiicola]